MMLLLKLRNNKGLVIFRVKHRLDTGILPASRRFF